MKKNGFAFWKVIVGMMILSGWFGGPPAAEAKVYIDIQAPSFRKFPIAISPLKARVSSNDLMRLGERATDILNSDLDFCGFFALVDPNSFTPGTKGNGSAVPSAEDSRPTAPGGQEIDFRGWADSGAEALVLGEIGYEDRSLVLEARLYDVVQKEMIIDRRYVGEITELSRMVHRFADEILLAMTGQQSIFQTKIVFVSKATGYKEIYLMDFDGRNIVQLTRHQSICLCPRFSPDGTKIAFTSYKAGNPNLYIKDLRTGEERVISSYPGLNFSPAWSPDGTRLALTLSKDGQSEIYTIGADGTGLTRLTDHPAIDVSPAWSPDGRKIAFVSNRGGNPQIYIMDDDGQNVQRVIFSGDYNTDPAWSPRGDLIAFDSRIDGTHNICTIRPDGTEFRVLTANLGRCEAPSWSPNGQFLAFTSMRDGDPDVFLIDIDGTHLKKLTFRGGGNTSPNWSPRFNQ